MEGIKPKILCVDDAPENLKILETILSKSGYDVITASDGKAALHYIQNGNIDLVLLDVMMPEMDGYEVCRMIKTQEHTKKIPVIFITATTDTSEQAKGFEVGGADFIIKPISSDVIGPRVKALLAHCEELRSLEEWNSNLKKRVLENLATIRKLKVIDSQEYNTGPH